MNVTIEEVNSIKRKLTVELPEEEARNVRKKHLDAYTKKARLKGFRPGKAPRSMVAKIYAEELRREVLEELVSENMPAILEEHKLEPVGMPQLEDVDYEEGKPFKFMVSVELKPQFQSPEWRGLELERVQGEVDGEMVAKKLEELRFSLGTVKQVEEDRGLEKGDLANLTYKGFEGERELPGMGGGPYNIDLDRDQMIPGFALGLMGMKAGETRDITATIPEDAENKALAGKEIRLHTTLNEIRRRELPELDDELAKDMGLDGVETLEALRDHIRRDLVKEKEERDDNMFNRQLTQILSGLVQIDVPTVMVEREVANKLETMRQNFGRNGMDFKKMGIDVGMLRQRFRPDAVRSVTAALVLDQIGRENNIEITDEDLERELQNMSADYHQPVEVLREYYKSQGLMDNLREGLKVAKTLDMIKAQARIAEVAQISPERLGYTPSAGDDEPEAPAAEEAAPADTPAE